MNRPPQSADGRWLVLLANLPSEDPAVRMRMLRMLESMGAAVMREGAYLLPDSPVCRQAAERLAEYVIRGAGAAQVLQVLPLSEAQQQSFRRLFDRSARYAELIKVVESLRIGFGIADPSAISRVLHKQRREFESISALDFFPSEMRERAARALGDAEEAARKLLFPAHAEGAQPTEEPLLRRTWATRRPLWADRLACAWLIRRFADPEGTVVWLDKGQVCPPSAIGFAFDGARFANSETRVTFEELLRRFGYQRNAALAKIGTIVHYLEVKRGAPVPEAAGVQTLLQGAQRRSTTDDELLHEAEKAFDLLYEAYNQ
jgi:hypothetical protein